MWQALLPMVLDALEKPMPTMLETLEIEVLRLPTADRSRLLDRLIASLDEDQTINEAWDREAARRDAEIENGTSTPVDGNEVLSRLRAEIR
jgi:hypothetical protein